MKKILNIKIIIRTLGFLLLFQSFFMLLASFVSFLYNESDVQPILLSAGITLTVALIATLSISKPTEPIGKREAYLVVALVWVVFSLFGLLPFLLSGSIPSFTDAFFETMSGFTTRSIYLNQCRKSFSWIIVLAEYYPMAGRYGYYSAFIGYFASIGHGWNAALLQKYQDLPKINCMLKLVLQLKHCGVFM